VWENQPYENPTKPTNLTNPTNPTNPTDYVALRVDVPMGDCVGEPTTEKHIYDTFRTPL
jgi:hypothetical protein